MDRGMKLPVWSIAWILPLFLTACFHRTHKLKVGKLAPPITQPAQPTKPKLEPTTVQLPPTVATVPPLPTVTITPPVLKPPARHRRPENRNREEAANAIPEVSAVGELSSGDPLSYRRQTEELIAATERGLKAITRPLDDAQQKTAEHIEQFLKQAKAALANGDVDGAHTLAAKAKVLLSELTQ
jgi:hypothetical protein